ncbi:MAG: transcription/translation regulatory transformer protein RfaH [Halioglobus sp.]
MINWYAVQTKPRQELIAEQNLQRQGFTTYLPRIRLRKRKRDSWVDAVEPLFPRYLFIHVDPDQNSLAPVRSTLGVATLVRFGQLLRPLPDAVIHYLKQLEDPETKQRQAEVWPHQPGDTLEVLEGPFANLTGIYQMPLGEDRALLLIELLGRSNSVAVAKEALAAPE